MSSNMSWLSIPELKVKLGLLPDTKLDFVVNPNTSKLFAVGNTATGQVKVKTEQSLDPNKPVRFMYEPGSFDEGCIVNVVPIVLNPPKFSL